MLIGIAILILVIIIIIRGERENSLLIRVTMKYVADILKTNTAANTKVANTAF